MIPTKIVHGLKSRKLLGKEVKSLGGNVVFVCTDKGIIDSGLVAEIIDALNKDHLAYVIFDETLTSPNMEIVEQGLSFYRNEQCDIILAVGGGSVIDTAKAIGAVLDNHTSIIAVPTSAGTGAEVTGRTIITKSSKDKTLVEIPSIHCKVAILDPIMLRTLPAQQAAISGITTLAHAVEGYISLESCEFTDLLNLRAIELVAKYLRRFAVN